MMAGHKAGLDLLLLRFDAPLMSFGGVRVDERGVTDEVPGVSLITGLLGNALGYEHREAERLDRLQVRLRLAVRCDRPGHLLEDFQTVDLGQPAMEPGWTTSHRPALRAGASGKATHIRRRQYWADAAFTLALTLEPAGEAPSIDELERALIEPERPLFLGRKPCLPADRLLLGRRRAPSLVTALAEAPLARSASAEACRREEVLALWWPIGDTLPSGVVQGKQRVTYDLRDWRNQVHAGRRRLYRGHLRPPGEARDDA